MQLPITFNLLQRLNRLLAQRPSTVLNVHGGVRRDLTYSIDVVLRRTPSSDAVFYNGVLLKHFLIERLGHVVRVAVLRPRARVDKGAAHVLHLFAFAVARDLLVRFLLRKRVELRLERLELAALLLEPARALDQLPFERFRLACAARVRVELLLFEIADLRPKYVEPLAEVYDFALNFLATRQPVGLLLQVVKLEILERFPLVVQDLLRAEELLEDLLVLVARFRDRVQPLLDLGHAVLSVLELPPAVLLVLDLRHLTVLHFSLNFARALRELLLAPLELVDFDQLRLVLAYDERPFHFELAIQLLLLQLDLRHFSLDVRHRR
uniref:Uncharacterized protein n=1 Tax=Photinus pyralis TaxID=7054 RepID=A0A1Y1KQH2_PHOPY